jgi:hypothetical protein
LAVRLTGSVKPRQDVPTAVSLAKGLLESAGIEAFLIGDHIGQLAGAFGPSAYGGIKLQVSLEDVEAADRLLVETDTQPGR